MTVSLAYLPVQAFLSNNGLPLVGGKLYSYQAGTSTPAATYTDSTGGTPLANPIILNARGEVATSTGASSGLWIPPNTAYKFVLQDSLGNLIWSVDQVIAPLTTAAFASFPGNIVPSTSNTYTLGSVARSWANLYLGPNITPVLNGGVIGYFPPTTAEGSTVVNPQYNYGIIDRYGTNTTPGTTDMSTALTNALAANSIVYGLAATYLFASTSGFVFNGKRIQGAGKNATILQFPNATSVPALSFQSVSGSYDTTAPGFSGVQILGISNTTATYGVALMSSDGGGCHGGFFSDAIIGGFQASGAYGLALIASKSNGVYDNLFLNVEVGPTSSNASMVNAAGVLLTTTDAPTQANRCNNNTFIGGGAVYNTNDGLHINYASENTFIGFDREQNGGWGINVAGICPDVTIVGGDSEGNSSGSITKANTSSSIALLGGNLTEAAGASNWNQYDKFFPGGTLAGNFGVTPSGNIYIAGTAVNITGTNPALLLSGSANWIVANSTTRSSQFYGSISPGSAASTSGTCNFWTVTGVPGAGLGANGDFAFRSDGGAGTCIYQKRAGSWVATGA
jgi:hypothetical protein